MIILNLLLFSMIFALLISPADTSECFVTLHSTQLELTERQINDACEDITSNGETFIPDFRDRGLIIKFITLGESVSISLPSIIN